MVFPSKVDEPCKDANRYVSDEVYIQDGIEGLFGEYNSWPKAILPKRQFSGSWLALSQVPCTVS